MIVTDASTLTDFLLGRPQALAAVRQELEGKEQEALHAPELIQLEILNALRRLSRNGAVNAERAEEAVADLAQVRLMRYPHAPLRERIWELRHELSAYDASYLALAETLPEPTLITGDAGLAERAHRSLGPEHVRHVP